MLYVLACIALGIVILHWVAMMVGIGWWMFSSKKKSNPPPKSSFERKHDKAFDKHIKEETLKDAIMSARSVDIEGIK